MKKNKIPYIEFLPIIVIAIVMYKAIDRIDGLVNILLYLLKILQPFFWGVGIAYALNPLVSFFEKKLKTKRIFSILLAYIIVLGVVITIITIVIPMITRNIIDLIDNYDLYKGKSIKYFNEVIVKSKVYTDLNLKKFMNIDAFTTYIADIPNTLTSILDHLFGFAFNFLGFLFKVIVGAVIAVYMLLDKDRFQLGIRKILYGNLTESKASKVVLFFKDVHHIFSRYIIGKSIDSLIIGFLCFIGLIIIDVRYAALLAIIVGLTNMIPYFGPFIGMVPAFILTIFYSPVKALWVVVFIFALQQFDGYYLGPKILGDSVGLSPFWIILGIIVGGSLMGLLGMLIAVPVVAVCQLIFTRIIEKKLANKNIIIE